MPLASFLVLFLRPSSHKLIDGTHVIRFFRALLWENSHCHSNQACSNPLHTFFIRRSNYDITPLKWWRRSDMQPPER
ncbi:hypothetical protein BGZ60DRAFT_394710 [Tricladium varicosporioides]|nr:hypothetical protein BGZ60DRAFT_394710 [Hymenoscyphus varicosporioides]